MTSPTVREFKPDDALAIMNRDGAQITSDLIIEQTKNGPAFTAVLDHSVLACGGVVIQWKGMGSAWMVLAEDIGSHGLWLSRVTIKFLKQIKHDYNLHRMEAMALEECTRNQAWLELCGFTRENNGIAKSYLPDKRSMVRYEWVEE